MRPDRAEYVERIVGWLMPKDDPELATRARESTGLDGVYTGKSARIRWLVRLAYMRGCRRGASSAWQARQPIGFRGVSPSGLRLAEMVERVQAVLAEADADDAPFVDSERLRAALAPTSAEGGE